MHVVTGVITKGLGDATHNIQAQREYFQKAGIPSSFFECGTINVNIAPHTYTLLQPAHVCTGVAWKEGLIEDFNFVPVKVRYKEKPYDGMIYIAALAPHGNSILEVLAEHIPGVSYGQSITLEIPEEAIALYPPHTDRQI